MTPTAPIRYSPDVEAVRADEGRTIDALNATFDRIVPDRSRGTPR